VRFISKASVAEENRKRAKPIAEKGLKGWYGGWAEDSIARR
jgi:hypothetical protein